MKKELIYVAEIPEGVEVTLDGKKLFAKGEKGENERIFHYPGIEMKIEDKKVILSCSLATKKEKSMMGSFISHIRNMIQGVNEGFIYKLKICSGHFPMNVETKGKEVFISNFLGEKKDRVAKILDNVTVKVDGNIITVNSCNVESAGQSAANIEKATKIKGRDKRIFQDGVFIIEKAGIVM